MSRLAGRPEHTPVTVLRHPQSTLPRHRRKRCPAFELTPRRVRSLDENASSAEEYSSNSYSFHGEPSLPSGAAFRAPKPHARNEWTVAEDEALRRCARPLSGDSAPEKTLLV